MINDLHYDTCAMSAIQARQQQYSANKLVKRLQRQVGRAIKMIRSLMVCLSATWAAGARADQIQQSGSETTRLSRHVLPARASAGWNIIEQDTYSVVKRVIPAHLRHCISSPVEHNISKIAHHLDDIVETLFLNLFYGGKLKAMPLRSDDNIVIRRHCREKDLQRLADLRDFPIIPCNLCGSQPNLQRQTIKQMLQHWDQHFPGKPYFVPSATCKHRNCRPLFLRCVAACQRRCRRPQRLHALLRLPVSKQTLTRP